MDKKLTLNDTIKIGKNKKILISDIVSIKGEIFKYIKKGFWFDDEVLEKAGIKRNVRDVKTECILVDKDKQPKVKIYPKETENLRSILKTINTLDNIDNNHNIIFEEENDNNYTNDLANLEDE